MIWFIGFVLIIGIRIFLAGRNPKQFTFGKNTRYSWHKPDDMDGEKLFKYAMITLVSAFAWPIVLPAFGIYKLGQHFGDKA